MKNLKKLVIVSAIMVASVFTTIASAEIYPLISPTGEVTSTQEFDSWVKIHSTQACVNRILTDNYAFVADCNKVWVKDHKEVKDKAPYMTEDFKMYLPTSVVNGIFGTSLTGEYTECSKVASATGLTMVFDRRGFCLLSKNTKPINTDFAGNIEGYRDYYTIIDAMSFIMWDDISPTEEDYATFISRWQEGLTYPEGKEEQYADEIETDIKDAYRVLGLVEISENGAFSDINIGALASNTDSKAFQSAVMSSYENIYAMAKGYYLQEEKDSELKKAILDSMEKVWEFYAMPKSFKITGSWTIYALDTPAISANCMALMYDEMTDEQRVKYANAAFDKLPDSVVPRGSYYGTRYQTNRSWQSLAYLCNAVLAHDEYRINHALKYQGEAFSYNFGDYDGKDAPFNGVYKDGGIVFHVSTPYNLGYGSSHVNNMATGLIYSYDTAFDYRNIPFYDNFYQMLEDNYLPFFVNDMKLKTVSGRWDPVGANTVVSSIMAVANHAPEDKKEKLSKAINALVLENEKYYSVANSSSNSAEKHAFQNETDNYWSYAKKYGKKNIETQGSVYNSMDRATKRYNGLYMTVALSSTRMGKYEGFSATAGGSDWYVNDGALYIYTDDKKQFDTNWMQKSNKLMIPGVTADQTEKDINFKAETGSQQSGNDWAGSVTDGDSVISSYMLDNTRFAAVSAKKSYFLFDDRAILLGCDIKDSKGDPYTVIDNRFTDKNPEESIEVSGEVKVKDVSNSLNTDKETLMTLFDGDVAVGFGTSVLESYTTIELEEKKSLSGMAIAFSKGNVRCAKFTISVSDDGEAFKEIGDYMASGKTQNLEFFPIKMDGKFIRITAHGNTSSDWFYPLEIKFYDTTADVEAIKKSFDMPVKGYNTIIVDGKEVDKVFNEEFTFTDAKYAYLDIFGGYVMLNGTPLTVRRDFIKDNGNAYAEFYVKHSEKEIGEYAYAMLPGRTPEDTASWAENPDIEIIENTPKCQAVKDKVSGKVGVSAYAPCTVEGITFDTPCVALIDSANSTVYVADPTHKLSEIKISVPESFKIKTTNNVTVENNTVSVDISSDITLVYSFEYEDTKSDVLRLADYNINMAGKSIETKLYAKGKKVKEFLIANAPESGTVKINGDMLYYYCDSKKVSEKIGIDVVFEDATKGRFNVIIKK